MIHALTTLSPGASTHAPTPDDDPAVFHTVFKQLETRRGHTEDAVQAMETAMYDEGRGVVGRVETIDFARYFIDASIDILGAYSQNRLQDTIEMYEQLLFHGVQPEFPELEEMRQFHPEPFVEMYFEKVEEGFQAGIESVYPSIKAYQASQTQFRYVHILPSESEGPFHIDATQEDAGIVFRVVNLGRGMATAYPEADPAIVDVGTYVVDVPTSSTTLGWSDIRVTVDHERWRPEAEPKTVHVRFDVFGPSPRYRLDETRAIVIHGKTQR